MFLFTVRFALFAAERLVKIVKRLVFAVFQRSCAVNPAETVDKIAYARKTAFFGYFRRLSLPQSSIAACSRRTFVM